MSHKHPLEIVLRHTGSAELLDRDDNVIWSSDEDADFKDEVSQEFLTEEDIDDILAYLSESEILSDAECAKFESDEWDVTEEALTDEEGEDDADHGDDDDFDSDESDDD